MIERLAIRELALVEELELELGPGLNVFTGETGAGKSIVLSALALLAGGRAQADACATAPTRRASRRCSTRALSPSSRTRCASAVCARPATATS